MRDRKSLTSEVIGNFDVNIAMDRDEHTPMLEEQFPTKRGSFYFLDIKDIFDWKPEKTISETILRVESLINDIIETGKLNLQK